MKSNYLLVFVILTIFVFRVKTEREKKYEKKSIEENMRKDIWNIIDNKKEVRVHQKNETTEIVDNIKQKNNPIMQKITISTNATAFKNDTILVLNSTKPINFTISRHTTKFINGRRIGETQMSKKVTSFIKERKSTLFIKSKKPQNDKILEKTTVKINRNFKEKNTIFANFTQARHITLKILYWSLLVSAIIWLVFFGCCFCLCFHKKSNTHWSFVERRSNSATRSTSSSQKSVNTSALRAQTKYNNSLSRSQRVTSQKYANSLDVSTNAHNLSTSNSENPIYRQILKSKINGLEKSSNIKSTLSTSSAMVKSTLSKTMSTSQKSDVFATKQPSSSSRSITTRAKSALTTGSLPKNYSRLSPLKNPIYKIGPKPK